MISLPGNQDVIHFKDGTSEVWGAGSRGGVAKSRAAAGRTSHSHQDRQVRAHKIFML